MPRILLAALALACVFSPAMAADSTVGIPWGDWLVDGARVVYSVMLPVIVPMIAAAVLKAIYRVYPWAELVLSQRRIEQMGQALAEYGLNAVEGAAKGKVLSIDVGSQVVAAGLRYGMERAAPAAIKAAGGPEAVAQLIFRLIHLEDTASAERVIPAALAQAGIAGDGVKP